MSNENVPSSSCLHYDLDFKFDACLSHSYALKTKYIWIGSNTIAVLFFKYNFIAFPVQAMTSTSETQIPSMIYKSINQLQNSNN